MSIGIIISCRQQWEYLPDAIKSVLVQTYKDWKLYVVGDDDYMPKMKELVFDKKNRIYYKIDGQHRGLSYRINEMLEICNTDYVLILGADDRLSPFYLEEVAGEFDRDPELIWLYADCTMWKKGKDEYRNEIDVHEQYQAGEFSRARLRKHNFIPCCSVVMDTYTVRRFGFNENLTWAEDWEMWLLLSKYYEPHYLPMNSYTRRDWTSIMRDDIWNKNIFMSVKRRIKRKLIKRKFRR